MQNFDRNENILSLMHNFLYNYVSVHTAKSDLLGTTPISYITLNLTPPVSKNKPTLLTVSEANSVFSQVSTCDECCCYY